MEKNIGTYHLADNPKLYEPARTNNFEFVVTGIDRLLYAGLNSDKEDYAENKFITTGQETIRMSVVSSTVPHFSLGVIDIKRGNNTMHAAGVPTFDNHTLVLNDFIGARTKSVLLAWQALAYDVQTEKVHRMSNYKKDCTLLEYAPDGELIRYWEMKGCWISALSEGEFSAEQNDKRTVNVTIVYDRAIPHLPDEEVAA